MNSPALSTPQRRRRIAARVLATLGILLIASLTTVVAVASWTAGGSGNGGGGVGTLSAPATVNVSAVSNTVTVNWAPVTPPDGVLTGYYVTRWQGATASSACGTVPGVIASYIPAGSVTCNDPGLADNTYRYTVTAAFRSWTAESGNSNVVSVVTDPSPPTQSLALAPGSSNAYLGGGVLYFRSAATGDFRIAATVTDVGSGPASASFPGLSTSGWTHPAEQVTSGVGSGPTTYTSNSYSWTAGSSVPPIHTITARDVANNTVATAISFAADDVNPTGEALTVNSVTSSSGGTTSFNNTGAFAINSRSDYIDAGSGIASSVLTMTSATLSGNTCGSFGSPTTLSGTPSQSGLTTGCYRYRLTGTDRVGNAVSIVTTVKVDLELPTGGALTVNGTAASGGGTTSSTNSGSFPIDVRTEWVDAESGLGSSVLQRQFATYAAGACGTYGSATALTGSPVQTGLSTGCYRYTLTGTDNAGNSSNISTVVRYDVTSPTAAALTVNGVAASGAGSTSISHAPSFTIGTRSDFTDAASGLSSSILTRESATLSGTTCGTFGGATVVVGTPTQTGLATGCYRYRLTGTDNAGNVATLSTIVSVRVYVTGASLISGTGTAGRVDAKDRFELTFSDSIAVSSLCSTWVGNTTDQVLDGNNDVIVQLNNGGAANDTMTVTTTACTLNIGTIDLGSTAYTTANLTFDGAGNNKSSVTWNAVSRKLTVTLGRASGAGSATVASSSPVVTPSTAITNVNAVPAGGFFTGLAAQQF